MLSQILDLTAQLNADHFVKIDVSQWQNVSIQVVGSVTGTNNITGSNDAGAVQSVTDGNAVSSLNYTAIQATNLATGAAVTAAAAAGIYKVVVSTKFIQIGGADAAVSGKLLVFLNTIK